MILAGRLIFSQKHVEELGIFQEKYSPQGAEY